MLATSLATLVLAIGATAYPAGSSATPLKDCSALPRWNNNTNIAGPWTILVDSCTNMTAAGGACSIKGFPASSDVKTSAQEKGIESGSVRAASHRPPTESPLTDFLDHDCQWPAQQWPEQRKDSAALQQRSQHI